MRLRARVGARVRSVLWSRGGSGRCRLRKGGTGQRLEAEAVVPSAGCGDGVWSPAKESELQTRERERQSRGQSRSGWRECSLGCVAVSAFEFCLEICYVTSRFLSFTLYSACLCPLEQQRRTRTLESRYEGPLTLLPSLQVQLY